MKVDNAHLCHRPNEGDATCVLDAGPWPERDPSVHVLLRWRVLGVEVVQRRRSLLAKSDNY
jgi:hypothetical protein